MYVITRILFSIVFLAVFSSCDTQREPLRLGTNIWPGYEPLYLARSLELLPESRIRLIEYPSATQVIRAFRNRTLELASLTLDEALILIHENIPVKIILVHDVSNGADTVLSRPEIASMAQISGKNVAVESSALGAYMITRALELAGLGIDDIEIRHLPVGEHEQAYDRGEVDAAVNFEPVRTRLINKGANEIFSSRQIYGEIVDVLVVHRDIYETSREALQLLVDSWFEALDHARREPEASARIMAGRLNITPAEVIDSFSGLDLPDRNENLRLIGGEQPVLADTIEKLTKILVKNRLVTGDSVTGELLAPDFL